MRLEGECFPLSSLPFHPPFASSIFSVASRIAFLHPRVPLSSATTTRSFLSIHRGPAFETSIGRLSPREISLDKHARDTASTRAFSRSVASPISKVAGQLFLLIGPGTSRVSVSRESGTDTGIPGRRTGKRYLACMHLTYTFHVAANCAPRRKDSQPSVCAPVLRDVRLDNDTGIAIKTK